MSEACQQKFLASLSTLSKEERFCDIQIEFSDCSRKFSKLLLTALSPFFDAMLSTDMQEGLSGVVKLPTVSAETFSTVLDYYMEGKGEMDKSTFLETLDASEMMQLPDLKHLCIKNMTENLSPENCLRIWQLSRNYSSDKTLSSNAFEMIINNFDVVSRQEEFLSLSKEDVHLIIERESFLMSQENVILEAVLRWIEANKPGEKVAGEMFSQVRLSLIDPSVILQIVYRDVVKRYKAVESVIREYALDSNRRMIPRSLEVRDVVIVCSSSESVLHVHVWDIQEKKWVDLSTEIPRQLSHFAATSADLKIIISGGQCEFASSPATLMFDTTTGQWTRGPKLAQARHKHNSVSANEFVYVIGGCSSTYLNSIEEWSPCSNRWKIVGNLYTAVAEAAVISSGQFILIIGGDNNTDRGTYAVQCFNTSSKCTFIVYNISGCAKFIRGDIFTNYVYLLVFNSSECKYYIHVLQLQHQDESIKVQSHKTGIAIPHESYRPSCGVVVIDGNVVAYTGDFTREIHVTSDLQIGTLPTVPTRVAAVQCAFRAQISGMCLQSR